MNEYYRHQAASRTTEQAVDELRTLASGPKGRRPDYVGTLSTLDASLIVDELAALRGQLDAVREHIAEHLSPDTATLQTVTTPRANNASPAPIVLPWKVLIADNGRHGLSRGRIILTEKYRLALSAAAVLASQQWSAQRRERLKDKVCLTVTLFEPDKRRRDIANYLKLIQDALVCTAYVDDSQIDRVVVVRGTLDRYRPRAEIDVRALVDAA